MGKRETTITSTINTVVVAPMKVLGTIAKTIGFGTGIGAKTLASKLMAWTATGGKVAKGISLLQSAGALVANAGVLSTIASLVGVTITTSAGISAFNCYRNATVMPLSQNDYEEMIKEINSIIESLKEPLKKMYYSSGSEDHNDDDDQFDSLWNDLSSRISSNVKLMDKEDMESDNGIELDREERTDESDL